MISENLMDELRKLNRVEKLRVIQMLVGEIVVEEEMYFTPDATYEVWSPFNSSSAAEILLKMLEEDHVQNG